MNLDKYAESYEILKDYHLVTLIDGSKHILNNDPATSIRLKDYVKEHFIKAELRELKVTEALAEATLETGMNRKARHAIIEAVKTLETELIELKLNSL
ncbi:hypothetical protein ABEP17_14400 [Priestia flexa]|uniref:hypothetical protein n=1 Tax=Priestia flexa TaxID=86664 RepID=UPI003D29ECCB